MYHCITDCHKFSGLKQCIFIFSQSHGIAGFSALRSVTRLKLRGQPRLRSHLKTLLESSESHHFCQNSTHQTSLIQSLLCLYFPAKWVPPKWQFILSKHTNWKNSRKNVMTRQKLQSFVTQSWKLYLIILAIVY